MSIYRRVIYVVEMADEKYEWVICSTGMNTNFSAAQQSKREIQAGYPKAKLRVTPYEPPAQRR